MRHYRYRFGLVAIAALLTSAIATAMTFAVSLVDRAFSFVDSMFKPEPMRFATEGPALDLSGHPLDDSLLHSMRHEANVSRRSAPRNC